MSEINPGETGGTPAVTRPSDEPAGTPSPEPAVTTPTETPPDAPSEQPAPPPGSMQEAMQADAQRIATRERAETLEDANARIRELEDGMADRVREEAEKILMDIFPHGEEPPTATMPAEVPRQLYPQGQLDDEEPSIEDRLMALEGRQQEIAVQNEMNRLNSQLDTLSEKYPHMEKSAVLMVLARYGDKQVNVENLCKLDHEQRLSKYERYHQNKLEHSRQQPTPPTVPAAPAATPAGPQTPKTFAEASKQLAARLKQRFGASQE